jgi:hypothetical protein
VRGNSSMIGSVVREMSFLLLDGTFKPYAYWYVLE